MNWKQIFHWFYRFAIIFGLFYILLDYEKAQALPKKASTKSIPCNSEKNIVRVSVHKVTDLSFIEVPKEVVPGNGAFDFKRVHNDVFIKALGPTAKSNVFVFVGKRRCHFDLVASEAGGDDLLEVKDPIENVMEVQFSDK